MLPMKFPRFWRRDRPAPLPLNAAIASFEMRLNDLQIEFSSFRESILENHAGQLSRVSRGDRAIAALGGQLDTLSQGILDQRRDLADLAIAYNVQLAALMESVEKFAAENAERDSSVE